MVANGPNEAVGNANGYGSYDTGMCLKWVRTCWEVGSLYGSAIDAWDGAKYRHPGDRTPPKGAPTFYRGGNYGHIVIEVNESSDVRSTDCTSSYDVGTVDVGWFESHWGYTYLGWAEDINGVRVIHEQGNDDVKDEDIAAIAKRVNSVLGDYDAEGKQEKGKGDPDHPDRGDERLRQIETTVRQLETKVQKILDAVT